MMEKILPRVYVIAGSMQQAAEAVKEYAIAAAAAAVVYVTESRQLLGLCPPSVILLAGEYWKSPAYNRGALESLESLGVSIVKAEPNWWLPRPRLGPQAFPTLNRLIGSAPPPTPKPTPIVKAEAVYRTQPEYVNGLTSQPDYFDATSMSDSLRQTVSGYIEDRVKREVLLGLAPTARPSAPRTKSEPPRMARKVRG
jgi:hypothetical protein